MGKGVKRTFILDTNVILFDPLAINKFGHNNEVCIPLVVIEEIDRFKRDQTETGCNARHFSRVIDNLRNQGGLTNGVVLDSGGRLHLYVHDKTNVLKDCPIALNSNDNTILSCALFYKEQGHNVTLVTKDINLRLKADFLKITAEDYGYKRDSFTDLYTGHREYSIDQDGLKQFEKNNFLPLSDEEIAKLDIYPNEYVSFTPAQENNNFGRFCAHKKGIVPLSKINERIWGIFPKNREQHFAIDALLNEHIKLVSLVGKAGTGKTLMAIAAGLEMTISQEKYGRLLVSRPIQPMGRDIGHLPGDISEKLGPWMQPIFDNMDFLFGQHRTEGSANYEELINHGLLHIEPLTYIRGRSIPGQYLIVDEAQNLSPHEIKTIITRAGEGTKVVLTGDCHQVDSPYLDEVNNGLVHALENLKKEDIVAHTLLIHGERSNLSEVASKYL